MLAALAAPAQAQYPERNITLIVPYGAGGGTDVTARMLARDLEAALGKPVTVENRAGGGGWVGWGSLAQAKPEDEAPSAISMCRACMPKLSLSQYKRSETLESFTPLMNHVLDYNKSEGGLRSRAQGRDRGGQENAGDDLPGVLGAGSDDLAILSIEAENKIKLITVHHKSTPEAKTQALGGHIQILGANISEVAEGQAGSVRILGVMSPERSRFLPAAPTFKGAGLQPGLVGVAGASPRPLACRRMSRQN